jgi:sugar phosphate isomerase/epimerase
LQVVGKNYLSFVFCLILFVTVRFGFSTFFFPRKPLIKLIDELVDHGLTAVELVYDIPHFDQFNDDLIAYLQARGKDGIYFSLHCPFLEVNLAGYFEEVRSFSRRLTEKAIEFAARAGCDPVVIHPGYTFLTNKVESIEHAARLSMIEALTPMAAFAKSHGITLGLENLQMPFFLLHDLKDFTGFKSIIPELGLVLDLGHAYIMKRHAQAADPEGAILDDLLDIGVDNVVHVHLSNNSGISDEHGFIKGDIDMKRVIQWLHDQGYRGRAIIESTEMERLGIPAVLEKVKEIEPK